MLKNYLKIAWRNLRKNKIDSFISIGGLAVGIACCILLVAYVRFEWTYDNFHKNADRIYRITNQSFNSRLGEIQRSAITSYPLSAALKSAYPEIDKVIDLGGMKVHYRIDDNFISQQVLLADPGFFDAFTFPLLYGNPQTALSQPNTLVITEKMAMQLFNNKQVVGKTIDIRILEEVYRYTVSAVTKTLPENSSIQFQMVLPYESKFKPIEPEQVRRIKESWSQGSGQTWVVMNEHASAEELEAKFPALLKTHLGDFAKNNKMKMGLQSLGNVYFNQDYDSVIPASTNKLYTLILGGIAIIILAIAGINFMSLTITRAVGKSHEIGIRKTVGAIRKQIAFQVMSEVFITCTIALTLGLALAELFSPVFQAIVEKPLQLGIISQPGVWLAIAVILCVLTLLTGAYPAFQISRMKATQLFTPNTATKRIPLFVKGLICVQFALTIALLIITFVMQKQLNYLFGKDLGLSSENVIAIQLNLEGERAADVASVFRHKASRIPGVLQVALSGSFYHEMPEEFRKRYGFGMGTNFAGTTLKGFGLGIVYESVDQYYFETMDIELIAGRNFSTERPTEMKNGILINEAFAQSMGWEHPVGKFIVEDSTKYELLFDGKKVIGVVENYHYRPLFQKLQPLALTHLSGSDYEIPETVLVKSANSRINETLQKLSVLWDEIVPYEEFNYAFLNELVMQQYVNVKRWSKIMGLASGMAIILACLGLFGLATLSTQRRTKEIGIRKVLGATVSNIVGLLSKDFLKLVAIGFVIAVPIAWYFMNKWLADFAYKIDIGIGIFLLAGGLALLIALATVSWQSIRAALANPVDSLRSE